MGINTSDGVRDQTEESGGSEKDISKGYSSFLTDKLITSNRCKSTNFITKDIWRNERCVRADVTS